jgi:hypothetical protein
MIQYALFRSLLCDEHSLKFSVAIFNKLSGIERACPEKLRAELDELLVGEGTVRIAIKAAENQLELVAARLEGDGRKQCKRLLLGQEAI